MCCWIGRVLRGAGRSARGGGLGAGALRDGEGGGENGGADELVDVFFWAGGGFSGK